MYMYVRASVQGSINNELKKKKKIERLEKRSKRKRINVQKMKQRCHAESIGCTMFFRNELQKGTGRL